MLHVLRGRSLSIQNHQVKDMSSIIGWTLLAIISIPLVVAVVGGLIFVVTVLSLFFINLIKDTWEDFRY